MPRENIWPRSHGDSNHPAFSAAIKWDPEHDVQVGVLAADGHHLVDALYADEQVVIGTALARWAFDHGAFLGRAYGFGDARLSDNVLIGYLHHEVPEGFYEAGDKVLRYRVGDPHPDGPEVTVELGREEASQIGRMVLDTITGSSPFGGSVWVDLDRPGINRLIRFGRKARDAVFGRDE